MGNDFEVVYHSGKENRVVNALSHLLESFSNDSHFRGAQPMALSSPITTCLDTLREEWQLDSQLKSLIDALKLDPQFKHGYTWTNGQLRYKGCFVLGTTSSLKDVILHDSPIGGHSKVRKTYHQIRRGFYWSGLKKDVQRYVTKCDVCQCNKSENVASLGLLQPLPIPIINLSDISMDFIEELPCFLRKNVIFMVVDRLSKYNHFIALSHLYSAMDITKLFIDHVF